MLVGKWLLFAACDQVVGDWQVVAEAAHDGRLWHAKVSPEASANGHVICVYTPSFEDRADVEATVHELHNLGLIRRPISYKPDVFTYALMYRRGESSIFSYLPYTRAVRATPSLERARELASNPELLKLSPGALAKRWRDAPPATSQPPLC
jgi:hypothetical protein